ncbi:MAG: response regulator [Phycisphaerae bacterium]
MADRFASTSHRKRILAWSTFMLVGGTLGASALTITILYNAHFSAELDDLQSMVMTQARFMESVARFDAVHSRHDHPQGAKGATLSQIIDAHKSVQAFHETGEFLLAQRTGDRIVFLLPRRFQTDTHQDTVPWRSNLVEPMRRALRGEHGTIVGLDYRGERVLAAYARIDVLDLGLVAKEDIAEIRAPFITAGAIAAGATLLLLLVGVGVSYRVTDPMIQRIEISEKKVRAALAELETQKFALDEHAIVAITDPSGTITYVNDKFCEISQYTREELIGRKHRLVNSGHHPRAFFAELWRTIAAGRVWHGDICNRAKDGSLYWVNTSIVPFKDRSGQIMQYVAIRSNVTERRLFEVELEAARRQADHANVAKSEFLANMSHEIRTPMTAILGFAENLLDSSRPESERVNCVHTIRRNGEHLLGLINDILDLSKIEAGKMTIEHVACHPCQIIADVVSLMRVRADAKGLSLKFEYTGAIPGTIQCDPTRLRQILINLTGNAIKFTEQGCVRLVTELVERNGEPHLQFDVVDTGVGLTEAQMGKLFNAFGQADTSTTRKFGGTGLGLAISKRFAELLGGDITVAATEVGVGSTFRVTVATGSLSGVKMLDDPMSATVLTDDATAGSRAIPSNLDGLRILLAEDGPDNQRLISFVLKKAGADVTVVENGKLALDAALAARDDGKPFDVILMDMQMPVMDGYEATGCLRLQGYHRPIIALTAHAMAGDREKCIRAGCDDYASKPIDRAVLLKQIGKLVDTTRARPAPVQDEPVAEPLLLTGCRILMAEDCPANQRLLRFVLAKEGADVSLQENGKLAVEAALSAREAGRAFDIILMDMQMPVMDGYEATRMLRRKGFVTPIIAVTAHAMTGDKEQCLLAGCDDYHTKPIDRTKLIEMIRHRWSGAAVLSATAS